MIGWGDFYREENTQGVCVFECLVGKRRKEYFGGVYTFYPAHHWRENVAFPNWEENERKERRLMGIYQKLIEKPITLSFFYIHFRDQ